MKNKDRILSRDFVLAFLAGLISSTIFFFLNATMPLYSQVLTGSALYTGFMPGAFSMAALLSRPCTNFFTRRKGLVFTLTMGASITLVSFIFYPLATTIYPLIVIRFLHGFGFGLFTTCVGAIVALVLPSSRLMQGIGIFNLAATLASAVGPGIALSIIGDNHSNFKPLFAICLSIAIVGVIASALISFERKAKKQQKDAQAEQTPEETAQLPVIPDDTRRILGIETTLVVPTITNFLLHFGQSAITAFLALYAIERGFGNVGLFFTITAVFVFVIRFAAGGIMDSRGSKILMIPAFAVYVCCFVAIGLLRSYTLLLIVAVVYGAAQGIINPTMYALCFKLSKPESRAVASAAYYTAIDLGTTAAGFVHNAIAMRSDYTAVYIFAAFLSILAFIGYLLCERTLAKLQQKTRKD